MDFYAKRNKNVTTEWKLSRVISFSRKKKQICLEVFLIAPDPDSPVLNKPPVGKGTDAPAWVSNNDVWRTQMKQISGVSMYIPVLLKLSELTKSAHFLVKCNTFYECLLFHLRKRVLFNWEIMVVMNQSNQKEEIKR